MVNDIVSQEPKAERSLMHRFNIALVHSLTSWLTLYMASVHGVHI